MAACFGRVVCPISGRSLKNRQAVPSWTELFMRQFWMLACLYLCFHAAALQAGTSNSLLDVSPDGRWLLAANPDNDSISLVDIHARKMIREIKVGRKPEGVSWIGAGPTALVALYEES